MDIRLAYDQRIFPQDRWTRSQILTVAIIGIPHPLSSERIGLTTCCLLDSSLTFATSFDVVTWFGWLNCLTALSSPTLLPDLIQPPQPVYCLNLLCLAFWLWLQGHLLKVWTLDITSLQGLQSEVLEWRRYSYPSKISITPPFPIL